MTIPRTITALMTLSLSLLLLAGCSSPRVTFYTLNPVAMPETTAAASTLDSVLIGPVVLPDLYDQPQLVVRVDANRVEILEMQRWAAPLKSEIPRILAENLAVLLKPARVATYPQNSGLDAEYRVQIDIQRYEMTAGQGVALDVLWSVKRTAGGTAKSGRSVVSEPAAAAGYDALVAAQSRALGTVSRDLAQALRALAAAPK
jgi:uncharacterized lipoprotein YmbA